MTKPPSTMTVRTFTMPKSLNETLASPQPPTKEVDRSSQANGPPYSEAQREPLASHKLENKPGITYASQETLPKLPIPELDKTCKNYLNALRPLQSRREQEDTAAVVTDFLKNEGPELDSRLRKYATGKTSYIEQFCKPTPGAISLQANIPRVRFIPKLRQFCRSQS